MIINQSTKEIYYIPCSEIKRLSHLKLLHIYYQITLRKFMVFFYYSSKIKNSSLCQGYKTLSVRFGALK